METEFSGIIGSIGNEAQQQTSFAGLKERPGDFAVAGGASTVQASAVPGNVTLVVVALTD